MQPVVVQERTTQKHVVDGQLVVVLTVDAVKVAHNVGRVACEHVIMALVRIVALSLNERGGEFLDSLAVLHHAALELRERVSPNLALDNNVSDAVHKRVNELVHHRAVFEQVVHCLGNITLRRSRNALLVRERSIGANRVQNLRVRRVQRLDSLSCHCCRPPCHR